MRLNQILGEILNQQKFSKFLLTQFDYCADPYVGEDKLEEYIKVMYKNRSKYKHKIRKRDYDTSIHLSTKSGKLIKGYDKVACIKDKSKKKRTDIILKYKDKEIRRLKLQELEEQIKNEISLYEGVIRLEISVKKNNLKYYYKTSKAKIKEAKKAGKPKEEIDQIKIEERTIDNYWTREKFQEQFLNEVKQYYYEGDYYKLSIAVQKIKDSNYSQVMKTKLILFLCRIDCVGIDRIKRIGIYSNVTMGNYIKKLNELGVNPITIDEDSEYDMLEGLYTLAVRQAESVYLKQKKKEF